MESDPKTGEKRLCRVRETVLIGPFDPGTQRAAYGTGWMFSQLSVSGSKLKVPPASPRAGTLMN